MKKLIAFSGVVLILLSLCSCGEKHSPSYNKTGTLPKGAGLKITALGDSIAAGYGLEDQKDNYLSIFAANIQATLKNDAVSGYDSADLLAKVKGSEIDTDLKNADMIIISVGGNDILHNYSLFSDTIKKAYPVGEYFTEEINEIYSDFNVNLSEILKTVRSKNLSAAIIVQTLYNPALKQGYKVSVINAGKLIDKYITHLNDCIKTVCAVYDNVFVFDVADEMNKDAENFYNLKTEFDIHPTKKGHLTLSELFEKYYGEN